MRMSVFTGLAVSLCLSAAAQAHWKMFLAAGQSNAMGITGDASRTGAVRCDTLTAYEYDCNNNRLVYLTDPVGLSGLGFDRALYGSAWPALAKRYHDLTGDTVVIVPAAKNASSLLQESDIIAGANWSASGQLFANAVTKVNRAETLAGVALCGIVWLQGETDAIAINDAVITKAQYKAGLVNLIARFRTAFGATVPFYIIRIGTDYTRDDAGFKQVREAQDEVGAADSLTEIVYRNTINFRALGWMTDGIHYSQTGLNQAGAGSADTIVLFEQRDATKAAAFAAGAHRLHKPFLPINASRYDIQGKMLRKGVAAPGVSIIRAAGRTDMRYLALPQER